MVTTVAGRKASLKDVEWADMSLDRPWALCLTPVSPVSVPGEAKAPVERDAVRLFVGCHNAVHSFDLLRGQHQCFRLHGDRHTTGLAVDEASGRLFAVAYERLFRIDLRTGDVVCLIDSLMEVDEGATILARGGPSSDSASGAVYDQATRSLIVCRSTHRIQRVRGIDV
jgi:hypothetical protein